MCVLSTIDKMPVRFPEGCGDRAGSGSSVTNNLCELAEANINNLILSTDRVKYVLASSFSIAYASELDGNTE